MSWLDELKVGDKVRMGWCLSNFTWNEDITKVTPAQIFCGSKKFRKTDGRPLGAQNWAYAILDGKDPE